MVGAGTMRSNMQPMVIEALPERTVYVGEAHKYVLPEDTFYDQVIGRLATAQQHAYLERCSPCRQVAASSPLLHTL